MTLGQEKLQGKPPTLVLLDEPHSSATATQLYNSANSTVNLNILWEHACVSVHTLHIMTGP